MSTLLQSDTGMDAEKLNDEKHIGRIDEVNDDVVLDTVLASEGEFTEQQYSKLLRKTDWTLLPLMWLAYGLQQADKTGTSTQATFGLRTDTGLVGQQVCLFCLLSNNFVFQTINIIVTAHQYAFLSTGFYIAYLIGEFPANVALQKFPVGKILAGFMFGWGLIVLCIAFCTNFSQLMGLRVVQGLLESIISPAFIVITGSWYVMSCLKHA